MAKKHNAHPKNITALRMAAFALAHADCVLGAF